MTHERKLDLALSLGAIVALSLVAWAALLAPLAWVLP